ncbi:MAG: hypothetical protein Tsb0032_36740 [Kiloniellaceae bacterium]
MRGIGQQRQRAGDQAADHLRAHETGGEQEGPEDALLAVGARAMTIAVTMVMGVPVMLMPHAALDHPPYTTWKPWA